VKEIYERAEESRIELNLYIKGEDADDVDGSPDGEGGAAQPHAGGDNEQVGAGEETTQESAS
jgi:hypothetical protein